MSEPLKTPEVCQLLNIKQPTLHKYTKEFQLNVIAEIQGQQKVILYPEDTVNLLKDIIEWRSDGLNYYQIKKKLGLNNEVIEIDSNYNNKEIPPQSTTDNKLIPYQNDLKDYIENYFNRIDKLILFTNNTQVISKELGEYKATLEGKERFIKQFQSDYINNTNELKSYYESIIKEIKSNNEAMINLIQLNHDKENDRLKADLDKSKSDLEKANLEIERLKGLVPWWRKKD